MLSFTVTGETAAEISQRLRDAAASFGASDLKAPSIEEKRAADAPKKETKSVQKAEPPAEKKAEPKKETAKPASGITLDTVAGKIAEICENKTRGGKDKAREILAKFGAKKGGELKPEQYADFIKEADAVLNPSEAASDDEGLM